MGGAESLNFCSYAGERFISLEAVSTWASFRPDSLLALAAKDIMASPIKTPITSAYDIGASAMLIIYQQRVR
jgi:hypothetical protein